MSLNWDVSKIANYAENFPDRVGSDGSRQWNIVTDSLVWYALMCGFQQINGKNVDEVAKRVFACERALGPMITKNTDTGFEPRRITYDEILKHIGLQTNCSNKTTAQFAKWLSTVILREAYNSVDFEKKKLTPVV